MRTGATAALAILAGYTTGIAMAGDLVDQWFTGVIAVALAFGLGCCIEGEAK